jgi:hypothetical protein
MINIEKTNRATVSVKFNSDTNINYTITANISVDATSGDKKVNNIESGVVYDATSNTEVANFSYYGNLNVNFYTVQADDKENEIISAIKEFRNELNSNVDNLNITF